MVGLTLARPLAKDVKAGSSLLGGLSVSSLGEVGRDPSNWATHRSFLCVHEPWMSKDLVNCCFQRWESLRV